MSIYDSSRSEQGDSERTKRAKLHLSLLVKNELTARGYKAEIKTGVPATFTEPKPVCYHLDLGVLFRSKKEFDFYHFMGIEIDDSSHATLKHEKRDRTRDESFFNDKGIVTCRIGIDAIFQERQDSEKFFDKYIWQPILTAYMEIPVNKIKEELRSEINRQFAIQLKENSSTSCSKCDHRAHQHDLTGCSFRLTNKSKMRCYCTNPYFRSDE